MCDQLILLSCSELFVDFQEKPIAAASIGQVSSFLHACHLISSFLCAQVHRATYKERNTGSLVPVVVKTSYPDGEKLTSADLATLKLLVCARFARFAWYQVRLNV